MIYLEEATSMHSEIGKVGAGSWSTEDGTNACRSTSEYLNPGICTWTSRFSRNDNYETAQKYRK